MVQIRLDKSKTVDEKPVDHGLLILHSFHENAIEISKEDNQFNPSLVLSVVRVSEDIEHSLKSFSFNSFLWSLAFVFGKEVNNVLSQLLPL